MSISDYFLKLLSCLQQLINMMKSNFFRISTVYFKCTDCK